MKEPSIFTPFDDHFEEKDQNDNPFENNSNKTPQEKTAGWKGLLAWGSKPKSNTNSIDKPDFTAPSNKPISEVEEFDKELHQQTNPKFYIPSPFEIRLEDKVESSYEYLGRTIKSGVKKIINVDKRIQNWAHGRNKEDQFLERQDEIQAEAVANSIDSFVGGNLKLNHISIDVNKRNRLDVQDIKNKMERDQPLKFNIRTKKDFYEQKKREQILNPFEDEEQLVIDESDKFPEVNTKTQTAPSQSVTSTPIINTPFLDEYMSETDSKNIFGTSSMVNKPRAQVKIFDDDDDDTNIFPSRTFKTAPFKKNHQSSKIERVMNDDFLNFGDPVTTTKDKDPFESVFD